MMQLLPFMSLQNAHSGCQTSRPEFICDLQHCVPLQAVRRHQFRSSQSLFSCKAIINCFELGAVHM